MPAEINRLTVDVLTSERHQRGIGRVAVLAARVETEVQAEIWALAGIDRDRGRAVTTHIAFRELSDILLSLARIRLGDDDAMALDRIIRRLKLARKKRNDLIHAVWSSSLITDEDPRAQIRKHRGKNQFEERVVTEREITALGNRFRDLERELVIFFHSRGIRVPSP